MTMKIIDLNENFKELEKSYIALGNFDGLHIAHMQIINKLVEKSREDNIKSSILLFKNHSTRYLENEENNNFKVLTSLHQKLEFLNDAGVDCVYLVDFTKLKELSPEDFIKYLREELNIKAIFIGFDYKYGKNAKGDVEYLENNSLGMKIYKQEPVLYDGEIVSSTRIKELISKDELTLAENLLGRAYFIEGTVNHGKNIGKKLGFPTANIKLNENYVLPPDGVYVSLVEVQGKRYKAATSVGLNKTFNEKIPKIEAHILDFNKIIYDEPISINFREKIRDMQKFDSLEKLIDVVYRDIIYVRNYGIIDK